MLQLCRDVDNDRFALEKAMTSSDKIAITVFFIATWFLILIRTKP